MDDDLLRSFFDDGENIEDEEVEEEESEDESYVGLTIALKRFLKAQKGIPQITEDDGRLPPKQSSLTSSSSFIIVTKELDEAAMKSGTPVADKPIDKKSRLFQPKLRVKLPNDSADTDDSISVIERTYVQKLDLVVGSDGTEKQVTPMVPQPLQQFHNRPQSYRDGYDAGKSHLEAFTSSMTSTFSKSPQLVSSQSAIPVFALGKDVSMFASEATLSPGLQISPISHSRSKSNVRQSLLHNRSPVISPVLRSLAPAVKAATKASSPGTSFIDLLASANSMPALYHHHHHQHPPHHVNTPPATKSRPITEALPENENENGNDCPDEEADLGSVVSALSMTDHAPCYDSSQVAFGSVTEMNMGRDDGDSASVETIVDNVGQFLTSFSVDEYKHLLAAKMREEAEQAKEEASRPVWESGMGAGPTRHAGVDLQHHKVWKPTGILTPYLPDQSELDEDHRLYVERQGMLSSFKVKMTPPPSLRLPGVTALLARTLIDVDGSMVVVDSTRDKDRPVEAPKPNSALAAGIAADAAKRKLKYQRELHRILGHASEESPRPGSGCESSADADEAETRSEAKIRKDAQSESGLTLGPRRESYVPQPSPETIAMLLSRRAATQNQAGGHRDSIFSSGVNTGGVGAFRSRAGSVVSVGSGFGGPASFMPAASAPPLEADIEKSLRRASKLITFTLPALRYGVAVNAKHELTSLEAQAVTPDLDRATVNPMNRDAEVKNLSAFFWKEEDEDMLEDNDADASEGRNNEQIDDSTIGVDGGGSIGHRVTAALAQLEVATSTCEYDIPSAETSPGKPFDSHQNDDEYVAPGTENPLLLDAQASLSEYLNNALLGGTTDYMYNSGVMLDGLGGSESGGSAGSGGASGGPSVPGTGGSKGSLSVMLDIADNYIANTIPKQSPEFHSITKFASPTSSTSISRRSSIMQPMLQTLNDNSRRGSLLSSGIRVGNFRRKSSSFSAGSLVIGHISRQTHHRKSPIEFSSSPSGGTGGSGVGMAEAGPLSRQTAKQVEAESVVSGENTIAKLPSRHELAMSESSAGAGLPVVFVPRSSVYSTVTIHSTAGEAALNSTANAHPLGLNASRLNVADDLPSLTLTTNRQAGREAALWQRSNSPPGLINASNADSESATDCLPPLVPVSPISSALAKSNSNNQLHLVYDSASTTPFPKAGSRLALLTPASRPYSGSGHAASAPNETAAASLWASQGVAHATSSPAAQPHVSRYDWATHAYRAGVSTPAELAALTQHMEAMIRTSTSNLEEIKEESARTDLLQRLQQRQLARGARTHTK